MSRVNGKMVTCDICGTGVFLTHTGEGETDGGWTRWDKFESLPEGWGKHDWYDLCPECYAKWKAIEDEFFAKEKEDGK